MKKLATVVAIIALIGPSAFAADMGAPPPAPAPVYNWSGWYVGGNIGASFGRVKTDFNVAPVTVLATEGVNSVQFQTPGLGGSNIENPSGLIGGGQIGYNWQLSPIWVVGLEADFQGADEKDRGTATQNFNVSFPPTSVFASATGSAVLDYQTKIEWFGTVRGRIGYLWGDGAVLTYVTGGWPTAG
jgi:outer membrane immunogenic protein